mgnify:CR=1 FL=1
MTGQSLLLFNLPLITLFRTRLLINYSMFGWNGTLYWPFTEVSNSYISNLSTFIHWISCMIFCKDLLTKNKIIRIFISQSSFGGSTKKTRLIKEHSIHPELPHMIKLIYSFTHVHGFNLLLLVFGYCLWH